MYVLAKSRIKTSCLQLTLICDLATPYAVCYHRENSYFGVSTENLIALDTAVQHTVHDRVALPRKKNLAGPVPVKEGGLGTPSYEITDSKHAYLHHCDLIPTVETTEQTMFSSAAYHNSRFHPQIVKDEAQNATLTI